MGGETTSYQCNICIQLHRQCDGAQPHCTPCIQNGDGCDSIEALLVPWDRSWNPARSVSHPSLTDQPLHSPSQVAARHSVLITGLTQLYSLLLSLCYLTPADVQFPPHTSPKHRIAVAKLRVYGFKPEALELLHHLPFLTRRGQAIELAPATRGLSYLEDADEEELQHARDPLGVRKNDVPPWAVRLTAAAGSEGVNYIYDTRDKTIAAWAPFSPSQQGEANNYLLLPRSPAPAVLEPLLTALTSLTPHLPWRTRHGPSMHTDPSLALQQLLRSYTNTAPPPPDSDAARILALEKAESNAYHSMRNIYLAHGWPAAFRPETFEEAREAWNAERERLEGLGRRPVVGEGEHGDVRVWEVGAAVEEFLRRGAGERAV